MKTVSYDKLGDSSVLQVTDMPKPEPADGEALVRIEYAGVNFIDTYFRSGLYPIDLPCIVGREGAGVIEALGPNVPAEYGLAPGDRVAIYAAKTHAQYATAPAVKILKLPDSLSTREGAAFMLQGLTAWCMLRDAHEVKAGETVLIQAAAGGTGGLMCQLAKALGATVIGTASTPKKLEIARSNGCDHVIQYTTTNVKEEVLRLTGGEGCHAVFSGIGKATFDDDLACTRRKGTFVTFGNSSGAVENFRPLALGAKNVKLLRPRLDMYIATREEFVQRSNELMQLYDQGKVKINIGGEYSMSEVGRAQDDLVGQKTTGKLLIKID